MVWPTKVVAQVLRYQLWAEARSMEFHDLRHQRPTMPLALVSG